MISSKTQTDETARLPCNTALLILLLSVLSGGWAIIIAGYFQTDERLSERTIRLGVTQVLLSAFVVGWFWAILSAVAIWRESSSAPTSGEVDVL